MSKNNNSIKSDMQNSKKTNKSDFNSTIEIGINSSFGGMVLSESSIASKETATSSFNIFQKTNPNLSEMSLFNSFFIAAKKAATSLLHISQEINSIDSSKYATLEILESIVIKSVKTSENSDLFSNNCRKNLKYIQDTVKKISPNNQITLKELLNKIKATIVSMYKEIKTYINKITAELTKLLNKNNATTDLKESLNQTEVDFNFSNSQSTIDLKNSTQKTINFTTKIKETISTFLDLGKNVDASMNSIGFLRNANNLSKSQ